MFAVNFYAYKCTSILRKLMRLVLKRTRSAVLRLNAVAYSVLVFAM